MFHLVVSTFSLRAVEASGSKHVAVADEDGYVNLIPSTSTSVHAGLTTFYFIDGQVRKTSSPGLRTTMPSWMLFGVTI